MHDTTTPMGSQSTSRPLNPGEVALPKRPYAPPSRHTISIGCHTESSSDKAGDHYSPSGAWKNSS